MKRFLVLLIVAVMAVPALFADVTVGGWGRIILATMGTDQDGVDPTMDMGPNWGGNGRVRFAIAGSADQIGFNFDVDGDGGTGWEDYSINAAEQLAIWIKPIDMIKITAGQKQIDTLRGKFGATSAAASNNVSSGDLEDGIFPRTRIGLGVGIEINPVEGLNIILSHEYENGVDTTVEETIKSITFAAGYTIEGIGLVRAGYFGEAATGVAAEDIAVAFNLTAVEGLNVDLGVLLDISEAADSTMISLGASYQVMDPLKLTLLAQMQLAEDAADSGRIGLGLNVAYSLGAVSINLETSAKILENDTNIMIYPYARMGLGNGYTSAGVKIDVGVDSEVMGWTIPVVLEYWF
jgi:hypothetical protein